MEEILFPKPMKNFPEALRFAWTHHRNQRRKISGKLYIVHPWRVSKMFSRDLLKTVSILHDVVEDCGVSIQEIQERFGKVVADGVNAMTKKEKEPYFKYIKRLKAGGDKRWIAVKVADIYDNYNDNSTEEMRERYKHALSILLLK